jgi:hypothetical protein
MNHKPVKGHHLPTNTHQLGARYQIRQRLCAPHPSDLLPTTAMETWKANLWKTPPLRTLMTLTTPSTRESAKVSTVGGTGEVGQIFCSSHWSPTPPTREGCTTSPSDATHHRGTPRLPPAIAKSVKDDTLTPKKNSVPTRPLPWRSLLSRAIFATTQGGLRLTGPQRTPPPLPWRLLVSSHKEGPSPRCRRR